MHPTRTIFAKEFEQLLDLQQVRDALFYLNEDNEQTTKDQIEITEVEAPPFHETNRAAFFKDKLEAYSLENLKIDSEGNVYGIRKGPGNDGFIFVEPGAPGDLFYCGVGSKRYNVTFKGRGGHSFGGLWYLKCHPYSRMPHWQI